MLMLIKYSFDKENYLVSNGEHYPDEKNCCDNFNIRKHFQ